METVAAFFLPAVVVLILGYGAVKKCRVFDTFLEGAKGGFRTALSVAPSLLALLLAVDMLRASGAIDLVGRLLAPAASLLGLPRETVPLALLSPLSGSGSVGVLKTILEQNGPDSFAGLCASVMGGSTETTFYAVTVYYGAIGVKKTRHTLPCAVCADWASFLLSPRFVSWLLRRQ